MMGTPYMPYYTNRVIAKGSERHPTCVSLNSTEPNSRPSNWSADRLLSGDKRFDWNLAKAASQDEPVYFFGEMVRTHPGLSACDSFHFTLNRSSSTCSTIITTFDH